MSEILTVIVVLGLIALLAPFAVLLTVEWYGRYCDWVFNRL